MSVSQTYPLDCAPHQIRALDANEYGHFVALLDNGEVWSNHWQTRLDWPVAFPLIRRIDAGRFLLVDARRGQPHNAGMFSATGELLLSFDAGDAVQEVLVQAGRIIIAYFDQAAGAPPPAGDILAVFDLSGQQVFGFNSSQPDFLLDCYALCPHDHNSVLFYAYPDFHLRELRLRNYQLQQWPIPPDVRGAHALTASRGTVIFWGSYHDQTGLYFWNPHAPVTRFGDLPVAAARGIGRGKFLTHDAYGFTVIDALELLRQQAPPRHSG